MRIQPGDKFISKVNATAYTNTNRRFEICMGREYTVDHIRDRYIGIYVGKNGILEIERKTFLQIFIPADVVNRNNSRDTVVCKWTNFYTSKGKLLATVLYDTKEEALKEYEDMKSIYKDVKLKKIFYYESNKNKILPS